MCVIILLIKGNPDVFYVFVLSCTQQAKYGQQAKDLILATEDVYALVFKPFYCNSTNSLSAVVLNNADFWPMYALSKRV